MDPRIANLAAAHVLVVGDLILDRYWHGETRRISPEAPVPVVQVNDTVERVGGAANVAANIAALGARATLVGVVGADAEATTLAALCDDAGIRTDFLTAPARATTVKLRVVSQRQQLVRLDFETPPDSAPAADVLRNATHQLTHCDLVVISDYAKGALTRVRDLIAAARAAGKAVIVDPKGADFSIYAGATLITPNLREFTAVVGPTPDNATLEARARELITAHNLGAILITRGAAGMSLVPANGAAGHIAAQAHDVFDVTGAGDTVCGVLAAAVATGCDLLTAVRIANVAAGLVVGRFGAATVGRAEIDAAMLARSGVRQGVLAREQLRQECADARRRGERIVMTNGCFDVLHAGHVRYLEAARALGSRLLVAVNDDESVRTLKGADRPWNSLASRMQVLSALSAVDWVVPFSDETPLALIREVLPDVLAKGGDYVADDIVGAADVRAAGGEVVVLDYHAGHSSTDLIGKLAAAPGDSA